MPSRALLINLGIRLAGLAVVASSIIARAPLGTSGPALLHAGALVLAVVGWLGWAASFRSPMPPARTSPVVLAMGVGGAVLSFDAPFGLAVVGTGALVAGTNLPIPGAIGSALAAPLTAILMVLLGRPEWSVVATIGVVTSVPLVIGAARRDGARTLLQAQHLALERERADVAASHAALLEERNRLGREVHDVLAHSLGALALQVEALAAELDDGARPAALKHRVETLGALVRQGLQEARTAVATLRDDPDPLDQRIAQLFQDGGSFAVRGAPRPITAAAALCLYRAAQEGLTNARRHGSDGSAAATLEYQAHAVVLTVTNPLGPAPARQTPPGNHFGLQGMRERAESVGGRVDAGTAHGLWRLSVEVPG